MKMRYSILSALSLAALAGSAFVTACSSDEAAGSTPTVVRDAGTTKDATAPTDSGSTTTTDSGSSTATDAGAPAVDSGCANVFVPNVRDAGGLYCYKGGGDAGNYCANAEVCCVTKSDAGRDWNSCTASSACSFDAGAVRKFECVQASDCTGGTVCCGLGATEPKPQCSYDQAADFKHKGTACKASCGTGETKICNSNADCATGTTCRPTTIWGTYVGTCR